MFYSNSTYPPLYGMDESKERFFFPGAFSSVIKFISRHVHNTWSRLGFFIFCGWGCGFVVRWYWARHLLIVLGLELFLMVG